MNRICVLGLDLYGCREALARLDDYVDRELSPLETRRVAQHLRICRRCAQVFRSEAELLAGLRAKVARLDTPELSAVRDRIALALRASTPPGAPVAETPSSEPGRAA